MHFDYRQWFAVSPSRSHSLSNPPYPTQHTHMQTFEKKEVIKHTVPSQISLLKWVKPERLILNSIKGTDFTSHQTLTQACRGAFLIFIAATGFWTSGAASLTAAVSISVSLAKRHSKLFQRDLANFWKNNVWLGGFYKEEGKKMSSVHNINRDASFFIIPASPSW